jgi:hypothetical protein
MSVPPSRRSGSTPPSKGRPEEAEEAKEKGGKEFKLPPRKQSFEEKEPEEQLPKKKGLFDIAASMEMPVQAKEQGLQKAMDVQELKATGLTAAEAVQQVSRISQLIQRTVESMHIGQFNQQSYASLQLKAAPEVPPSFAGSNLTISYHENGISIRFDNFMTPQQQNTAITLVERHKEQLQDMVQALNSKNIQIAELAIGTHTISLPRVQPLPPPFKIEPPSPGTEQQRERGDQEREGGEGGGRGGGPR